MFKLDYKTDTRYDGCNNILSPLDIKADDNYHPIFICTVSFSAKYVLLLAGLGNQICWILDMIKMLVWIVLNILYSVISKETRPSLPRFLSKNPAKCHRGNFCLVFPS